MLKNLRIASNIIRTHRTRTFLSVLGVVIGIMSVIAIIDAGEILKSYVKKSIEVFGTDYIEVEVKVPSASQASAENAVGQAQGITITTLKHNDALAIKKHPNVKQIYSGVLGQEVVSYRDTNKVGYLLGVSEGFFEIDKTNIVLGRGFTKEENNSLAQVAILGNTIKEDLFGDTNPIGQKIKINKRNFKVIGVREKVGFMGMYDDMILMPLSTLQKKIMGIEHVSFIMASMVDTAQSEQTATEITEIMRAQHNITDPDKDDFGVTSSDEAMNMLDTILNAMTMFLVAIAAVSLIVGGVGIMNIMLVNVTERTSEIGLRKAVGATYSHILKQFLTESATITLLGGIIGIIGGILISWAIAIAANHFHYKWDFIITPLSIILGIGISATVGIIFGSYPAAKAAKMEPVEALRNE